MDWHDELRRDEGTEREGGKEHKFHFLVFFKLIRISDGNMMLNLMGRYELAHINHRRSWKICLETL